MSDSIPQVTQWFFSIGQQDDEDRWESFLLAANEWFISYALPPFSISSVKLFSIGHTIELYLKAANTKITGDIKGSVKFGHRIKDIWEDCKSKDPNFMSSYEIRESVFSAPLFSGQELNMILSEEDYKHYLSNQELYIVARLLPDLKYLGAPLKSIKGNYTLAFTHPSQYWLTFIKNLRDYLGEPPNTMDIIRYHVEEENPMPGSKLPDETLRYLRGLFN